MTTSLADLADDRLLLAAVVADEKSLDRKDAVPRGWLAAWMVDGRIIQTLTSGQRLARLGEAASLLLVRQSAWHADFIELDVAARDRCEAAVFVTLDINPRTESVELAALARLISQLPQGPRLTQSVLAQQLDGAVAQAIRAFAGESELADLVERPNEARLLDLISAALAKALFTGGLELRGIVRLRVESDDYDQRRQTERQAAQAEEVAKLTAQIGQAQHRTRSEELDRLAEVMDRLSELGQRLGDVAGEGPRARQLGALLARLTPADQQAVVSGSLELAEDESAEPPAVLLAAGSELLLVSPGKGEPVPLLGLDEAVRATGPLRWIGLAEPGLMLGGRDGLAIARVEAAPSPATGQPEVITADADTVYVLPASDGQSPRRGGINSAAIAGSYIIATHSEVGVIAWPLGGSDRIGRVVVPAPAGVSDRRASITGGSMSVSVPGHSVRAATVAGNEQFVFAVDNNVFRAEMHADGSAAHACLLTVRSAVTSLAVDGDDLYVGEHAGHLTRIAGGKAEIVASLAGPIASIQPIVHGWLTRLLISAGPAGLALVQPDTRLTTALGQPGSGARQAAYSRGWVIAISGRRDRVAWYRRLAPGGPAEPDIQVPVFTRLGHSAQAIVALT